MVMDLFENEIRLVLDPENSHPHDITLALIYLAALAITANVELGRPVKQSPSPKKRYLQSLRDSMMPGVKPSGIVPLVQIQYCKGTFSPPSFGA